MAKKYGVTWWGQQWLNSLTQIDYYNRLPKGRANASAGKVRSMDVKGNQINARVQGDQTALYRVSIAVPLFTSDEKQRLIAAVANDEAAIAQLVKLQLPQELRKHAENQRVRIFPESWKDFSMQCSCTEATTPCEHLAAVIFEIAEEVDKNPFILFELHEMNLMKELEAHYQRMESRKAEQVPNADGLLAPPPKSGGLISVSGQQPSKPLPPHMLDFTTIPEAGTQVLMLFRANEFFEGVEIKEVVHQCFADASEAATDLLRGNVPPVDLPFRTEQEDRFQLIFDDNLRLKSLECWDITARQRQLLDFHSSDLFELLYDFDFETLHRAHPNTVVLLHVFSFSLNLTKNGTIWPQLLQCPDGRYRVRWLPAIIVKEVKELFEKIAPTLAPDLVVVEKRGTKRNLSPKEMLNALCSYFIGRCVTAYAKDDANPLVQMFHGIAETPTQSFENQDVAEGIHRWLNNFYRQTKKDYLPVVKVEEGKRQYDVELMVEYRPTPLMPPIPLAQFLTQKKYDDVRDDVMKDLQLVEEFFPQAGQLLEAGGQGRLSYNPTRFIDVLRRNLPAVELFGIKTTLPVGMKEAVKPRVTLLVDKAPKKKSTLLLPFHQQFQFEWQVALGERLLSVPEFESLVSSENGVVRLDGRYAIIDEDELVELFNWLESPPELTWAEQLQVLLSRQFRRAKVGFTPDAEAHLKTFTTTKEVPLPKKLTAELANYQLSGYDWLMKNSRFGFGSLLADDMGLGKPVQVIAALAKFKDEGLLDKSKALLVTPWALIANWQHKLEQYAPKLATIVYLDKNQPLDTAAPDVVITTYETVAAAAEMLGKPSWYCIVADEAQWLGDASAEATRELKALHSEVRIAIMSRPIEHRLAELWSIMDFANPAYLGSPKEFQVQFARPILREHDQRRAALLQKIIEPLLLRRLRSDKDITVDLSEQLENQLFAPLAPAQRDLCEALVQRDLKLALGEKEDSRRRAIVTGLLRELRRLCDHPYLQVRTSSKSAEHSGKMQVLFSLLDNAHDNGEKTLIITQFPDMGELLAQSIKSAFGKEPLFLHPNTGLQQKEEMISVFQTNTVFDTFVLATTPTAAGIGLSSATNIVLFDRWWNPAMEAQLIGRAVRNSQAKGTMVWRLTTASCFEERLDEVMRTNPALAELTIVAGEDWVGELPVPTLEWVFAGTGNPSANG